MNRFETSNEINWLLGGIVRCFILLTRSTELMTLWVDLKLVISRKIELNLLATLYAGALKYETIGLIGQLFLCIFGSPYNLGGWGFKLTKKYKSFSETVR